MTAIIIGLCLTTLSSFAQKFENVVVNPTVQHHYSKVDAGETNQTVQEEEQPSAVTPISTELRLRLFIEEDDWKNELVGWMLPKSLWTRMPRFFRAWFRNAVFGYAVYFITGGLWVYYIYFVFGRDIFGKGNMPAVNDVKDQIVVAVQAMPFYSLLPVITEMMVERGWTAAYARVSEVGLVMYFVYFTIYMLCVEFGVYWMHRLLHEIPIGYRTLHHIHHKYNKEHSLSPFAGLAFHPLDGILQAVPYTVVLFFVPLHFLTHEMMLFMTGVWTTNIHDNIHENCFPIMGAGYHTIHHTTYKDNYGHYTVLFDWLFGTLISPEEYKRKMAWKKK
eukprot:TRINITY_DN28237_c1_g1_i1.p1 TRINITY_DN28237_c1_g1~~TRINITY_DN28237_c1_g1_i1.p1  ORF type:complete len:357 (-),score=44.11 TRINITY_DN28237_c1_g1_i1:359-1357(-)